MASKISKGNKLQDGVPSRTDQKRLAFLRSRLQSESGQDAAETRAEIEALEKDEADYIKKDY